ncbi:hypothetical protein HYT55_02120 [Candidatus Woesearchaeota archaeon]|nr:hypothetical protein [Candidatus Woesearchaeota archaeon]
MVLDFHSDDISSFYLRYSPEIEALGYTLSCSLDVSENPGTLEVIISPQENQPLILPEQEERIRAILPITYKRETHEYPVYVRFEEEPFTIF